MALFLAQCMISCLLLYTAYWLNVFAVVPSRLIQRIPLCMPWNWLLTFIELPVWFLCDRIDVIESLWHAQRIFNLVKCWYYGVLLLKVFRDREEVRGVKGLYSILSGSLGGICNVHGLKRKLILYDWQSRYNYSTPLGPHWPVNFTPHYFLASRKCVFECDFWK